MKPWQWVAVVVGVLVATGGGIVIASPWSGPPVNVPSSINSVCGADVTSSLDAFLTTVVNGEQVVFPSGGCYKVNGDDNGVGDPALVISNLKNIMVNGNGSTFEDVTTPTNATIWEALNGYNINFENMTITGVDTTCAYNATYEYQFGIDYQATQGGTVNNVTINNVAGDFVEAEYNHVIGPTTSLPATNITIENSAFTCAGRMGIGLTDVSGAIIQNNTIASVNWSGIDVETDVYQEQGSNIQVLNNHFTSITLAVFSNHGQGSYPNVGNITFNGNVETNTPGTCESAWEVGAPSAGLYRWNYTIENNTLYSGGAGFDVEDVNNATISGNTAIWTVGLGCGQPDYGVYLVDSHTIAITNNTFTNYGSSGGGVYKADGLTTGLTVSGNTA